MKKELQDYVWQNCLPKEFKEEVKYYYQRTDCGTYAEDMLESIFGIHNLTSDAEGEDEMLHVSRKQIDTLQGEIFKAIMDAHDADDWQDAAHYILDVMPRSFAALFGSKCLPDEGTDCTPVEVGVAENTTTSNVESLDSNVDSLEPKPAEPRFKVGDKVRIVHHLGEDTPLKGEVCEIVEVDEEDPVCTYYIHNFSGEWYSQSDLEPYTEQEENQNPSNSTGLNSKEADRQFDNIVKDSFSKERRLNIAAMMVPSVIATVPCSENEKGYAKMVATRARILADALIKEAQKGGE